MTDSPQMQAFFRRLEEDTKKHGRSELMETAVMAAIGGGLGWWAYGTVAHSFLFAFVVFSATAAGNRIMGELRQRRAQDEASRLLDEQDGR